MNGSLYPHFPESFNKHCVASCSLNG